MAVAEFPVAAGNSKTYFSCKKLFPGKAEKSFCLGKQMLAASMKSLWVLKKYVAGFFSEERNYISHKQTNIKSRDFFSFVWV